MKFTDYIRKMQSKRNFVAKQNKRQAIKASLKNLDDFNAIAYDNNPQSMPTNQFSKFTYMAEFSNYYEEEPIQITGIRLRVKSGQKLDEYDREILRRYLAAKNGRELEKTRQENRLQSQAINQGSMWLRKMF